MPQYMFDAETSSYTLVTDNMLAFVRVPGLKFEKLGIITTTDDSFPLTIHLRRCLSS